MGKGNIFTFILIAILVVQTSHAGGEFLYLLPTPIQTEVELSRSLQVPQDATLTTMSRLKTSIIPTLAGFIPAMAYVPNFPTWGLAGVVFVFTQGLALYAEIQHLSKWYLAHQNAGQLETELAALEAIPGVVETVVLGSQSASAEENSILSKLKYTGYAVVKTMRDIQNDPKVIARYGPPIRLSSGQDISVQVHLSTDTTVESAEWNTSLLALMAGAEPPPKIKESWQSAIAKFEARRRFSDRWLTRQNDKNLMLQMTLIHPSGAPLESKLTFSGNEVRKLVQGGVPSSNLKKYCAWTLY